VPANSPTRRPASSQIGPPGDARCEAALVSGRDLARRAIQHGPSSVEEQSTIAKAGHHGRVVTDHHHGSPIGDELVIALGAARLEAGVANRKDLV